MLVPQDHIFVPVFVRTVRKSHIMSFDPWFCKHIRRIDQLKQPPGDNKSIKYRSYSVLCAMCVFLSSKGEDKKSRMNVFMCEGKSTPTIGVSLMQFHWAVDEGGIIYLTLI